MEMFNKVLKQNNQLMATLAELSKERTVINYQNCNNKKMTINVFLNEWIYPVLYVWIDIITAIIVPQFWLLTNTQFTSRQAKRLFGPIGAAAAFANIIIGFSMQHFITTLGTDFLLPISPSHPKS